MADDTKYEQIEKFLAGTLSGDELEVFEKSLQSDAELQAEVDLHRQVGETLKGEKIHEFRDVLKTVDQKWENPQEKKTAKKFTLPFRSLLAAAAIALLLIFAYPFLFPKSDVSGSALFAANFEPYKMILNQRSSGDEEDLMSQAVSAYEQKDYAKASSLFQKIQAEKTDADALRLYIGVAELSLGNADKAISELKIIVEAAPPLLVEQSRWYLALAYLKKGDNKNAIALLENIQSGTFKYDAAQKILEQIQ